MRSRDLKTKYAINVTDYTITPDVSGHYMHSFHPISTSTRYQFWGDQNPLLEDGKIYNIAYHEEDSQNWVDVDSIAPADEVDPIESHRVARQEGERIRARETQISNERISHTATVGEYLGRKYARRIYGMHFSNEVFDEYLQSNHHPWVPCVVQKPNSIATQSIAYKDEGLDVAMDLLVSSLVRIDKNRFSSPLLPSHKWFTVTGIPALTDKK